MASAGNRVLMLVENQAYPQDMRVRQEAIALAEAGYQVSVISKRDVKQPWRELVNGVKVFRYPSPPESNTFLGYIWEYAYSLVATFILSLFICWRPGFDIIHAANPPDTFVLIALIYKLFGKRFVFDHHDLVPEMYSIRFNGKAHRFAYHLAVWLEKLSCRVADCVIATNQSYKDIEITRGHIPPERVTIVRNGPSFDRFHPVDPDHGLRQKNKIIIGYVGVMAFQDGVDYLLRALKRLIVDLSRADFYCVVIGKGDALASLNDLATQLELDEHVWLTGFVSDADLLRYLSTVDICVDPDPSNPFNDRCTMIKMMEYMALGKPIVAFDLPEHRITAQGAALYARANDELDFARKISDLMDDPELRMNLGRTGKERIKNELAWSYQIQNLLKVYKNINIS